MPKLLDRYIFAELLPPFLVSLAALCFIILTKELLRLVELLITKGLGFLTVLKVFLHLLPSFLVLTLPIAALIASITAFGRFSFDKELVAMRAAGLSLLRLSGPVLVFSGLVFGLTLFLSQWGQPWQSVSAKKIALNLLRDQLPLALDKGVFNEPVPRVVIYVPDTSDRTTSPGIFISDEREPDKPRIIVASRYSFLNVVQSGQWGLRLTDVVIHTKPDDPEQQHYFKFPYHDYTLPKDPNLGAVDLIPSRAEVLAQLDRTNWTDPTALRRLMEYNKELAFPTAALIFGLLGVPVGIVSKRSGRIGGFAVGVMILIVYYVFNILGEFCVTTRVLSPLAGAWFPNGVYAVVTAALYVHTNRR